MARTGARKSSSDVSRYETFIFHGCMSDVPEKGTFDRVPLPASLSDWKRLDLKADVLVSIQHTGSTSVIMIDTESIYVALSGS
jgi:hypothetical protein